MIRQDGLVATIIVFVIGIAMLIFGAVGAFAFHERTSGIAGGYMPSAQAGGSGSLFYPSGADPEEVGKCLNSWFSKKRPDSPLADKGLIFAGEGKKYNVNPALMIAIAGAETTYATNYGAASSSTHNYQSMTCNTAKLGDYPCVPSNGSNPRDWEDFPDYDTSIANHAEYMQRKYLSKGITDIRSIGEIYCGKNCNHWFDVVPKVFNEIIGSCPSLKTATASNIIRGDYVKLNVPLVGQKTSMTCGRASVAMVLNYYGGNWTIDDTYSGGPVNTPSAALSQLKKQSGKAWKVGRVSSNGNGWSTVMKSLKAKNPVILFQRFHFNSNCQRSRSSYGHIIVIRGYDPATDTLMVNSSTTRGAYSCQLDRSLYNQASNLSHTDSSGTIIYSHE